MNYRAAIIITASMVQAAALGCSSDDNPSDTDSGGTSATGGNKATGGTTNTAGSKATAGAKATGGSSATAGATNAAGATSTGGSPATGGAAMGGAATGGAATAGATAAGGVVATGGTISAGGIAGGAGTAAAGSAGAIVGGNSGVAGAAGNATVDTAGSAGVAGAATAGTAGTAGDAGNAGTAGTAGVAGGASTGTTILTDPINAGAINDWTPPPTAYNPTVTIAEVTSPYDGGTAIQTTAFGNTTMTCDMKRSWREYTLPSEVQSDHVVFNLYLALDSDSTYYNWPGFEIYLYAGGTFVGYSVYYRGASIGGHFDSSWTSNWHDIVNDGYQQLTLSPLLDTTSAVATAPIAFDTFRVNLVNYTCEGNNTVIFDALSVVSVP